MPDKPNNLADAFEALGNSTLKDHQRWQLLALILSEIALASGIDIEQLIDYTD